MELMTNQGNLNLLFPFLFNSRSQGRSKTSIPSVDLSKCAEELTASFTKETKVKKLKVINARPESSGKTLEMDINHIQLSDMNV